jgi:hypothetical protein
MRQSLYQLREETIARTAANDAARLLASPGMTLSQQLDVSAERVILRMNVAESVPEQKVREAEKLLLRRTGKEASIAVRQVASEEELARLRERFRTPAPPPPPQDLNSIRSELIARVAESLKEVWPSESALLLTYELGFTPKDVLVRVRYKLGLCARNRRACGSDGVSDGGRFRLHSAV